MEDDDGNTICAVCEKNLDEDYDGETYDCQECDETICEDCIVNELEEVILCKDCLKKIPAMVIEKEKIVEKPVPVEVVREVVRVMGFSEPIL